MKYLLLIILIILSIYQTWEAVKLQRLAKQKMKEADVVLERLKKAFPEERTKGESNE